MGMVDAAMMEAEAKHEVGQAVANGGDPTGQAGGIVGVSAATIKETEAVEALLAEAQLALAEGDTWPAETASMETAS